MYSASSQLSPTSVANYFVNRALSEGGTELTPMKLLKLVYLSHGWYLGLNDAKPLIAEAVQAWKFGPVITSVYHDFKSYNNSQITALAFDIASASYSCVTDPSKVTFLDRIWEVYKGYSGLQLSTLTHEPGSPWDIVWNNYNGKNEHGAIIPNNIIAEYYRNKANGNG
jgi:uncharacterized phage-associated protein